MIGNADAEALSPKLYKNLTPKPKTQTDQRAPRLSGQGKSSLRPCDRPGGWVGKVCSSLAFGPSGFAESRRRLGSS